MAIASRLKIMLVDDEMYVLESLKAILREANHTVEGFSNPIKALDAYKKKHDYDLVISDIRMPDMTGDVLITEIRKIVPDQICVAITAYADKDKLTQIIKSGHVFRILLKPWKNAEILKTAEHAAVEIQKRKAAAQTQPGQGAGSQDGNAGTYV